MTHALTHAGVCLCGDEGSECTCNHDKENEQQVSHCGSEEGDCHCHDGKPHEHEEAMVATHSHHLHNEKKSLNQRIQPYSRLVTTLVVVFAFGVILSMIIGFSWMSVMEYWMGGYFVAFGVQQALSLKKSAAMFRQYDPLAKRVVAYSYALPFIQIALGLAYFFMVWWIVVGFTALTILLINLFGVDKVIQSQKVVRCGCLGEGMNVPVGRVTLWENLIMIAMVVMMLTYHAMMFLATGGADTTSMPGMRM